MVEQYREARKTVEKKGARLGFIYHLMTYIIGSIVMIVVDLTTSPGVIWFVWPLLGWGLGLFGVHLTLAVLLFDLFWEREERAIKRMLEK